MKKNLLLTIMVLAVMFVQAQNMDSEKIARHLNRADVCIEMNHVDDAINEYEEIVKIAPNWPNVYMYLANTYALKGDDASLKKAMENYNKFMQLTDDQELYYEAQDKLSRVEMMAELKAKEEKKNENIIGTWRSNLYNKYTGQPLFVVNISETPISGKYQITLLPQSMMYNNIVNTKAYSEIYNDKISWSYTIQDTYIPSQSKYNAAGAAVNLLFGSGSVASTVGNVLVEGARESDRGYTNIMDFDFIADVNIQNEDEIYMKLCNGYLDGSLQMRGEHHQAGHSNVDLDTVYECDFLKGEGYFPVFEKITKKRLWYYYGDIKIVDYKLIGEYSPYVSKEEFEKGYRKIKRITSWYGFESVVPEMAAILGGVLLFKPETFYKSEEIDKIENAKKIGRPLLIVGSALTVLVNYRFISTNIKWDRYIKRCVETHNIQVQENENRFKQKDQASVSVNVGLTPTGPGISVNF